MDQLNDHIENEEARSYCQVAVGYHDPHIATNLNRHKRVASQLGKGANQLGKQRGQYTKRSKVTNSPTRAHKIATKFKDNLSFLNCACCPFSDPQDLFMPIEEFRKTNYTSLKYHGIRKAHRVEQLLSKSTEQANAHAFEFQEAFTEFGLLKGLEYLCKRCRGGLAGSYPGNGKTVDVASMFGGVIPTTSTRRKNRVQGF